MGESGPPHGTVLVVDDQPAQRMVMETVLGPLAREAGVLVVSAGSGPEALQLLGQRPAREPVLLLADASMPGMDGLQLIAQAHDQAGDRPLRCVLWTGHDAATVEEAARGHPVAAVVTKPMGIDGVREALRAQLEAWRARMA